jgi:hypothetical protein
LRALSDHRAVEHLKALAARRRGRLADNAAHAAAYLELFARPPIRTEQPTAITREPFGQ